MSINLDEIQAARAAIFASAGKMLRAELSYLEGSRIILNLLHVARIDRSSRFAPFVGVVSQTDHLPLGRERKLWNSEALIAQQSEIDRMEQWAKSLAEPACRTLIQDCWDRPVLRVETSFQDTPGDGYYFVLNYKGRPLKEQLDELCLRDGDQVILWEEDCDDFELLVELVFDYRHPMMLCNDLWAKEVR